jgi:outer membrane lipoprotein-sorting protein
VKPLYLALILLLGCVKPSGPIVPAIVGDPDVVVALARRQNTADTLQGRFSVKIEMQDRSFTVPAAILMDHPDRFRFELYTPLGTPLGTLTSDGTALHAWSQRDRTFYEGNTATAVLKEITGGEVSVHDFLAIITGTMPLIDAEILHVGRTVFDEEGVVIVMLGPDDIRVRAVIDPRLGVVKRLRVDPPSKLAGYETPTTSPIIEVLYEGIVREGRSVLPQRITFDLPRLGWKIRMDNKRWRALNQAPDAFTMTPPSGATIKDLVEAIEAMGD